MLLPLLLLGCKAVDPAPADLDGLLHWFWQRHDEGLDEELHEGVRNAFDLVDVEALDEAVQDGSLTDLTADEAALVGVTDRDPALAAGVYLLNVFQCDLATLQPILYAQDQATLYPGVYDAYQRTYTDSVEDYAQAVAHDLTWDTVYSSSILGASYTADTRGGLRRVPVEDAEVAPHGEVILQRTYMPLPAAFENDNKSFDQDYQVEVYVDAGGGRVLHLYGLWRSADYGSGFDAENESVQRLLLNGLADWDDQTETLCLDGGV